MKVVLLILAILVIVQMQFNSSEAFFFQNRQNVKGQMVSSYRNKQNMHGYGRTGAYNQRKTINQCCGNGNNVYGQRSAFNQNQPVNPLA